MRRLVLSLGLVLALGGGAALAQTGSPAPSAAPSPAPAVVHIKNFAYVPDTVTIRPGQSVRFIEDDETPHTVTASDNAFDSGNLDKGKSWTHVFAKEGTYAYYCAYHTYMKGNVVVKAP
ncbi:MAG TPA: cupredoxin family copper-binding protein [Candidatus Elarobacter sp.]|jgi:plastocyanin|nr:cupredoxin family copper-binding protein [Candidatus Elarobacter sp.]